MSQPAFPDIVVVRVAAGLRPALVLRVVNPDDPGQGQLATCDLLVLDAPANALLLAAQREQVRPGQLQLNRWTAR